MTRRRMYEESRACDALVTPPVFTFTARRWTECAGRVTWGARANDCLGAQQHPNGERWRCGTQCTKFIVTPIFKPR